MLFDKEILKGYTLRNVCLMSVIITVMITQ